MRRFFGPYSAHFGLSKVTLYLVQVLGQTGQIRKIGFSGGLTRFDIMFIRVLKAHFRLSGAKWDKYPPVFLLGGIRIFGFLSVVGNRPDRTRAANAEFRLFWAFFRLSDLPEQIPIFFSARPYSENRSKSWSDIGQNIHHAKIHKNERNF